MAKTVVEFTASWIPPDGEKDDANCSISGMIQVVDGKSTSHYACIVLRDYGNGKPSWWPGVTVPQKKAISYGPDQGDEEFYKTNLQCIEIKKDAHFKVTSPTGDKLMYRITKVVDLTTR